MDKAKKRKKRTFTKYKCDVCAKQFSDRNGLSKHQHIHSGETYQCMQCDYTGTTPQYLRRHVRVSHGTRKFECKVCNKWFHFGCKLKDHMRVHTGEKPYKCGECDKAFNSSYSLNTHKLIHANSKPFKCSYCPYACRDSSTLRKHQARHEGLVTYYQCNMCDTSCKSKANLKVHIAEKHLEVDMRRLECDACGKRFRFRQQLVTHIRTVHDKSQSAKCDICGIVVCNKYRLRYHMRIHVDEKPFVCTVEGCNKRYKDTSSLRYHSLTHYPAKQFPCKICDRLFTREKRMQDHLKTHMPKVKNVECDYCGVSCSPTCFGFIRNPSLRSPPSVHTTSHTNGGISDTETFYNKATLSNHILRKHGRKKQKYICDLCDLVTTNKPSIVMHLKYGHADKNNVFICAVCEKIFKRDFNLQLHYWEKHEIKYEIPNRKMKKQRKDKQPTVEVKEEIEDIVGPCVNLYDADEFFEVSPKLEPFEDIGLEEEASSAGAGGPEAEPDVLEALVTRTLRPPRKDRRKHSRDFVDTKSEELVLKQVDDLMEKRRRKVAARALERTRRKYNRLMRRAIKNNNTKTHYKVIYRKINKDKSNSLDNVSKNQTMPTKEQDESTKDNIEDANNIEPKDKDNGIDNSGESSGTETYIPKNDEDDDDDYIPKEKKETNMGQNRKLQINTHQCYVCFKLYQTEEELLEHCKDHFDLCNITTLKKCPLCDYATNLSVTVHLKRKHNIKIKVPYGTFADDNIEGSKYYYKVNDDTIKKVEIIPSIKNLNKRASNKIDKNNRDKKNKGLLKRKLVKKGKEWIVLNEKMKMNDYTLPKLEKIDTADPKGGYLDRLKELYKVAKKEGKKMLFPCEFCDKVCQSLCGLKLHGRKHETNPKPFKPKVWKHKMGTPIETKKDKKIVTNFDNRTAQPKPVVNKHKCDKELIEFYERNIKGSDVEFWQFLKIYNKMGRENVNDFDDLQKSTSFGLHCNVELENTNEVDESNVNNVDVRAKINANKVKRPVRNAFKRVIRLSRHEFKMREEAKKRLREKIKSRQC